MGTRKRSLSRTLLYKQWTTLRDVRAMLLFNFSTSPGSPLNNKPLGKARYTVPFQSSTGKYANDLVFCPSPTVTCHVRERIVILPSRRWENFYFGTYITIFARTTSCVCLWLYESFCVFITLQFIPF